MPQIMYEEYSDNAIIIPQLKTVKYILSFKPDIASLSLNCIINLF